MWDLRLWKLVTWIVLIGNVQLKLHSPFFQKMADDSKILCLPLEILNEIRSYLNCSSMCSLMLVSKGWKEVWENPFLWSEFKLEEHFLQSNDKNDLENILKTRRFSELKSVNIPILDKDILTVISKKLIN